MGFNLDDYEPVADRIERFWKDHPEGKILTDLVYHDEASFIVKSSIWRKNPTTIIMQASSMGETIEGILSSPDTTGFAQEIIGSTNVNRTSALENCETSAIGRALANLGYAVKNRASREEMVKAQPAPRPRSGPQQRTPKVVNRLPGAILDGPQAPENHKTAPKTDLGPDVAAEVKRMKNWAFAQLEGDVDKTKAIWEQTISTYELNAEGLPDKDSLQFIESDLSIAVGEALTLELVEP